MTSLSLTGLWAAVGAGLGLTVRVDHGIPETLRIGGIDLPPLGDLGLTLHRRKGSKSPSVHRLAEIIEESVRSQMANSRV